MEERMALLQKFQNGEITGGEYEVQLKEVVKVNKPTVEDVSPILLKLTRPHGGYVIMCGKNMQKFYQVSAIKLAWHSLSWTQTDLVNSTRQNQTA
jgi:hypothetical protein